jgi:hypothetical protein
LVEAVATSLRDHRVLPLARRVWSSEQFVSQNHEVMQAIHEVLPYVSRAALWVLDRGLDSARFFSSFNRLGMKWVIRQRGDRNVILPHVPHTMPMAELAEVIDTPHVARPWVSRDNKLVREEVRFGSCTVDLTDGERYTLVVVRFSDSAKPMMLLSNVRVRRTEDAARIVVAYFRRWAAEEQIRADKQLHHLEDVRVLRYTALIRLMVLTVIASGVLALEQARSLRRARWLARSAPIVGPVPPFRSYRVRMAVQFMLRPPMPRLE